MAIDTTSGRSTKGRIPFLSDVFEDTGVVLEDIGQGVGDFVDTVTGEKTREAIEEASQAQESAAQAGIDEQRRQFDVLTELLSDYVGAGTTALQAQLDLAGLGDPGSQEAQIQAIQDSPQFQALTQSGEEAILANAAATGGLRGGNVQRALGQFRPRLLSNLITQRMGTLSGIAGRGQSAAAGQGSAGIQTGANVANLLQQQGAYQAGGILSRAQAGQQGLSNLLNIGGALLPFILPGAPPVQPGNALQGGF